jgi:hypothetical protein
MHFPHLSSFSFDELTGDWLKGTFSKEKLAQLNVSENVLDLYDEQPHF